MRADRESTYESVALSVLVYEFPFSERRETEKKIESRLKRKKLGALDGARVELLRRLKDDVQKEIGRQGDSAYYVGPASPRRQEVFVEMSDFDLPRLTADMVERHPEIPAAEIRWFVPFATFIYHML
jgi:hypothetical protein